MTRINLYKFIILFTLSFQSFAKDYHSECIINISSDKHPGLIHLVIENESIFIQLNNDLLICDFKDDYQMEIFFYRCGDYNVSFRDNLKELIFAGHRYRCDLKSN